MSIVRYTWWAWWTETFLCLLVTLSNDNIDKQRHFSVYKSIGNLVGLLNRDISLFTSQFATWSAWRTQTFPCSWVTLSHGNTDEQRHFYVHNSICHIVGPINRDIFVFMSHFVTLSAWWTETFLCSQGRLN